MAIERQRGTIGHKRYGMANWPRLGYRLELPQHPLRRVNLCGCDTNVTMTKNEPPPLVLQQFQPATKLGPIGHTISLWEIWPLLVLYGILAISLFPGLLWPQEISCHHWTFMAPGHILPSLASLANSQIPNPQASIFVLGLGGLSAF
ncbi:hypothetical protein O181_118690 [Austropuccinia psidii MF-1]|uniref:Uncharacterized protein n=1 Tax=Austropuccinia psidii MF-1 TaxID=1389203 RepID=A0A9Q3PZM2_9BASI|nr:hypothetical protein [Austropuccinia psidii MF-1]